MPVKRRTPKRRHLSPEDEADLWRQVFETGWDYFADLEAMGLSEAEARKRAPEAWARLGTIFLGSWKPSAAVRVPWALEQFGAPV